MDILTIAFLVGAVLFVVSAVAPKQLADAGILTFPSSPVEVGTRISQPFKPGPNGHNGVDFAVPVGTILFNVAPGVVEEVGEDDESGRFVLVRGLPPFETVEWSYSHMETPDVAFGQLLGPADVVGTSGNTGDTTGPHLHFRVAVNGESVDPVPFLVGAV